jgi:hypothetical protein
LLKLDTVGGISGLMLLGLHNATIMHAFTKRGLSFGAVAAWMSLQAQGQSGWAGIMMLLPHDPGW